MEKSIGSYKKLKKSKQAENTREAVLNPVTKRRRLYSRYWMGALMLVSDCVAWGMALALTLFLATWFHVSKIYHPAYSFLPIFYLIFAYAGRLYSMVGLNPVDEMRKLFYALSASVALAVLMIFFFPSGEMVNPLILLMSWGFLFLIMLFLRWITRIFAVKLNCWGEPVAIMAQRERGENFINYFGNRRRLGILPTLLIDGAESDSLALEGIAHISAEEMLKLPSTYYSSQGICTLLLDINAIRFLTEPEARLKLTKRFSKIIFMADMDWLEGASFIVRDFEGMSGFEARKNSLSPTNSVIKRGMDIVGALLLGLISAPFWILAMIAIRFDSKDPIFYTQARVGRKGKTIHILKFRTMVKNAEGKLLEYLADDPIAKEEWDTTQKLKNDPRITKPGRWIRKLSIDELPQLFNILKGEMSLVGPRPMMLDQTVPYGIKNITAYHSVRPGLTGMWQVSGRNKTTFTERAKFDLYYVRNWSIWLDVYILLRTIWVVVTQDGAN